MKEKESKVPAVVKEETYEEAKKRCLKYIRETKYFTVEQVKYTFDVLPDSEIGAKLYKDKDILREMAKKNANVTVKIFDKLRVKAMEGNITAIKTVLSLVGSEEELARLNGGGVKLEDVKQLGRGQGSIIINNISQSPQAKQANARKKIAVKSPDIEDADYEEADK